MGFDLYGLNPQKNEDEPLQLTKLKSKFENEDGWMQYDKMSEKQKEKYFKLVDKEEANNPGRYFRNNVWFWRPLWAFVCESCDDILSLDDADGGTYNDGQVISKTKAVKIGKRLSELLADGTVDEIHRKNELDRARADVLNKVVEEKLEKLKETVKKETGKEDLVPAKYPEPYKTQWNEIYGTKSWTSDYPFHKENVENFARFCLQSGGFEIC